MAEFVEEGDVFDPADAAKLTEKQQAAVKDRDSEVLAFLERRQNAYRRVFQGNALTGDADVVMNDLIAFCRGDTSAFHTDERIHTLLTGRQEVWIRVQDHLRLTLDALLVKYTQPLNKD